MRPPEVLKENVEWMMERRRLSQESLALRMQSLGFGWYRRTVNRLLRGERRLGFDELLGLALALDTTAGMLTGPSIAESLEGSPFDGSYEIGVLPEISALDYASLSIRVSGAPDSFPTMRVEWSEPSDAAPPTWMPRFRGGLFDRIREALADGGWSDEGEFLDAHPEVAPLPVAELVGFIEVHPKPPI